MHQSLPNQRPTSHISLDSFRAKSQKAIAKLLIVTLLVLDIPVVPLIGSSNIAEAAALVTDPNAWVTVNPKADPMMQNLNIPANAAMQGMWAGVYNWPINGMHSNLLPDGRVLTYGTTPTGSDGNGRWYDFWNPALGFGANSHNTTYSDQTFDSFCSTASYLTNGDLMVTGGNTSLNTTIVQWKNDARTNSVAQLADERWYATLLTLPDARKVILGGMNPGTEYMEGEPDQAIASGFPSMTPEIYENGAWRSLVGARSRDAFGPDFLRTSYPKAFVAPNGQVFGISADRMWYLDVNANNGSGAITYVAPFKRGYGQMADPVNVGALAAAAMYDIGKIIQVGGNGGWNQTGGPASNMATAFDINNGAPVVTELPRMTYPRRMANATVLADGKVAITGGTRTANDNGPQGIYAVEIWNPQTNTWTVGPNMTVWRAYHSTAILLENGAILSAGGGTPGPQINLNAEIYYPPNLFEQVGGASRLAARPAIKGISGLKYAHGATMQLDMDSTSPIKGLVLMGLATTTHDNNSNQRRIPLQFTQEDNRLTATIPNANLTPPGYYHVVALNAQGVPSYANVIAVGTQMAAPQVATTPYNPGAVTPPPPPPANVPPTVALTAPAAGTAYTQGSTVAMTANAADSDGTVAYVDFYDGGTLIGSDTSAPYAFNWATSVATAVGNHNITAVAVDNAGAQTISAARSITINQISNTADSDSDGIVDILDIYPNDATRGAGIWREQYNNIGGGVLVSDLTAAAKFPNAPDVVEKVANFAGPVNIADNYGTRIRGIFTAPTTGAYTFWIAGDDEARLYLSTDNTAGNKRQIAYVPGWSDANQWTKYAEQKSVTINLVAGQNYYLEALQKEGGGGDNISVAWQTPTNNTITVMTDQFFQKAGGSTPPTNNPPANAVNCAVEDATCTLPAGVTATVWFGAGTTWNNKTGVTGSIGCNNDVFGDPIPGTVKSCRYVSTTTPPVAGPAPTASTAIVFEKRTGANNRVWVVNPDNDSVSVLDATTKALIQSIPVGLAPRTIAIAPNGNIWVTNKDSATISVISPTTLAVVQTIAMPRASQPFGLAFAPNGSSAFVVLEALGQLRKLDPTNGALQATLAVGSNPRHVSVTADSATALVSRFITPALPGEGTATVDTTTAGAEVLAVNAGAMTLNKTIVLRHSDRADSDISASGIPNYLGATAISPDGKTAWVPSKQDNIKRGIARNGQPLNFQNTVRAISSRIDMATLTENLAARIDHDNASLGSAAVYHPSGNYLFVALETSREVAVLNAAGTQLYRINVGRAPQGLAISADGNTLYVQEFMDRSVAVIDLTRLIAEGAPINGVPNATVTNVVFTVPLNQEKLPANVLLGKQFFYDAKDARLSRDSYMSCASCHNDGGHDGRVWDLTGFGEGLRNTIALKGRAAIGHGNLHWSANFDELQDFEGQIRALAGGTGLMTDAQFNTGTRNQPLGDKKAGVSEDLDLLAAYVASLNTFAQSPNRNADGTLTAAATAGKTVFANSCASCHGGASFTTSSDGTNLKNIGTINALSGQRLGAALTGLDVPTLRDVWATAPYLHNGSAATVTAAVQAHNNLTLNTTDLANVVAYVQQIGSEEAAIAVNPPSATDADGDGIVDALDLYPNDATRGAGIWREQYNNIGGGVLVSDLTTAAKYPNAADVVEKVTTFAGPTNIADNYGTRIRGIFTAPTTGAYTFWVAGDDEARLYLSTDNTAAKKTQIAFVPGWSDANQWTKYAEQKSVTINLVAGQNYYLEALQKEGGGGDNLSVAWQTPTNNAITVMTDQFFQKAGGVTPPPPPANVAPTVVLTAPAAGTAITQGATVAITATAADSDGTVARVEFYDGATLLGTDAATPYAFNWVTTAATAAGAHSLTAKAYDNTGAVTTSAAVGVTVNAPSANVAPTVSLTAPAAGTAITQGATVAITATAADSDGTVARVEFYDGATLLGTDATAPYAFSWVTTTSTTVGAHSLTAKAYDNTGVVTTSAAVGVTVNAPANVAPTVSITAPAAGTAIIHGTTVAITATAADSDGTVARVEFYDGATLLGTDTTAPYAFSWVTTAATTTGAHSLTARAYDNTGAVTTSAAVSVTINAPAGGGSAVDTDGDGIVDALDIYPNDATRGAGIWREQYNNIGAGDTVATLTSAAKYPNAPDVVAKMATFTSPDNIGDNYGSRIRGIFTAPETGAYTFWVAGDNETRLYLSTDNTAAKKAQIAFVPGWSLSNEWTKYPEQKSVTINLVAGQNYYMEVLHKEGWGGDGVAVAWQTPSNATRTVMTDQYFQKAGGTPPPPPANVAPTVSLTAPAAGTAYTQGATVAITATAADSDGTVARVEFYDDATLLGTDTTAPYAFSWVTTAATTTGAHSLTARAFDNTGAATTSATRSITINAPASGGGTGTLPTGVAGAWSFNEGMGATVADASGNNHPLTLSNTTWVTGISGQAAQFNGADASATAGQALVDTAGSFSVSAWVKLDDLYDWQTFVNQDGANVSGFWLQFSEYVNGNKFVLTMHDADSTASGAFRAVSTTTPVVGQWYHLVGVRDKVAGTMKIYVNGQLEGTTQYAGGWASNGALNVGRGKWGGPGDWVAGGIDGVSVYNRALTDADVATLYQAKGN